MARAAASTIATKRREDATHALQEVGVQPYVIAGTKIWTKQRVLVRTLDREDIEGEVIHVANDTLVVEPTGEQFGFAREKIRKLHRENTWHGRLFRATYISEDQIDSIQYKHRAR